MAEWAGRRSAGSGYLRTIAKMMQRLNSTAIIEELGLLPVQSFGHLIYLH